MVDANTEVGRARAANIDCVAMRRQGQDIMTSREPSTFQTLSRRARRRFWGWGTVDVALTAAELDRLGAMARQLGGALLAAQEPREADFDLPAPKIAPPATLAGMCSTSAYDRLTHSLGKSYADCARMWLRRLPDVVDLVAFPHDERSVVDLLDWATAARVAVIPFGGGSSVCGGVEPAVGDGHAGTLSIDLERLHRVLEFDPDSRAARIQAGALGPELEMQLKAHGVTLRHFPQSFEFSTLGGWIATRAGGHYATLLTHIDDLVECTRTVTPAGALQTRRVPASGAGPAPDRLILGSEGTLGIVTEAWMRVQDRPRFRASASVRFKQYPQAVQAVRAIAQSGLYPANCRLLDPAETLFSGSGDGSHALLVLAFESADHALDAWMQRAMELARDFGGEGDIDAGDGDHRRGAGGAWRNAFLRMPYWRDPAVGSGLIMDTFETAVTWDRFAALYDAVRQGVADLAQRTTGRDAFVSCRFTHVYPDGPAPYFSFALPGGAPGDVASALAAWREIKRGINALVIDHGGTSTHHHAVGRDHRPAYQNEVPLLYREMLRAAKRVADPAGIMNPGVLIDPWGAVAGPAGALA
jgi:alkyldihydroxyacetonephosphate synthase